MHVTHIFLDPSVSFQLLLPALSNIPRMDQDQLADLAPCMHDFHEFLKTRAGSIGFVLSCLGYGYLRTPISGKLTSAATQNHCCHALQRKI